MNEKPSVILYLDDDKDDIELLQESFLSDAMYKVIGVQNATQLFEQLNLLGDKIALLVMDINLMAINGVKVLEHLRTNTKYKLLPIVMLSTTRNPSELNKVASLESVVIQKPASMDGIKSLREKLVKYCRD
jgi:CheY-like chemotaxis protein